MLSNIDQLRACLFISFSILASAKKELQLLHVLSINKFYVPDNEYSSLLASKEFKDLKFLTYEYFTRNALDIPNSVKLDFFNLGVELRKNYDKFLGSIYGNKISQMRTTEFSVSIMIGELINAGLWPPVEPQVWNKNLAWQPIPFEYISAEQDTLLLGTLCPNFQLETRKVLKSDLYDRLKSIHSDLLKRLNETGQTKVSNLLEIPLLYFTLENSIKSKRSLPEWIKKIYPKRKQDLINATLAAYDLLSQTKVQKQLNGGTLIKKIAVNCIKHIAANGTLAGQRKIEIYSGDDRVFQGVMRNLNIPLYDVPDSGAVLIFELYAENENYFLKLVYNKGGKNESLALTLPGCDIFCPIDNFTNFMAEYLPFDEAVPCFANNSTTDELSGSSSKTLFSSNLLLAFISFIFVFAKTNVP